MSTQLTRESQLDRLYEGFDLGEVKASIDRVAAKLKVMRDESSAEVWAEFVEHCRTPHPLLDHLRLGPVTGRSFRKPRGYAGDAETLDLIYGLGGDRSRWSAEARRLYDWEFDAPASRAVRDRADALGKILDESAGRKNRIRALSVACGHLREVRNAKSLQDGRIATLFALDQDASSLEVVRRDNPNRCLETVQGSVRQLLGKRIRFANVDLIWSAGLYDYLQVPVARALTAALFSMLAPEGRLVLVNFAPELPDIGYMEVAMAWHLIYRSEAEMEALVSALPEDEVASVRTWREEARNLVFLELTKN